MEAGTQGSTRVYIRDRLGADEVSEDVRIMIDSREAGRFSLDQRHRASVIPVETSPGQRSYVWLVPSSVDTKLS